ncbi:hypothetical protein ARMSODRAFT_865808, partial [Armillaria solidipes]
PTYKLVLHSVPTTFRPHSEDDRNGIFYANHDVTPFSLREIRWLNAAEAVKPSKHTSSLVLTFSDEETAERVFDQGLYIEGTHAFGTWYWEGPDQCYKCQQYGHRSYRCPSPQPVCARCAGHHPTQLC